MEWTHEGSDEGHQLFQRRELFKGAHDACMYHLFKFVRVSYLMREFCLWYNGALYATKPVNLIITLGTISQSLKDHQKWI